MLSCRAVLGSGPWLPIWSVCSFAVRAARSSGLSDPLPRGIKTAPRIIQLGPGDSVNVQVYGQCKIRLPEG